MEITKLYTEFYDSLFAYVHRRVKSKEDAEDILQTVFIKIATHVDSLKNTKQVRWWVYTITRNSIIDYYRSTNKGKHVELAEVEQHIYDEIPTENTMGLDQCIRNMISQLPETYRSIIIDSEINSIGQKELAKKYNMPYSSMRSRVQRGRSRLQQILLACCAIETDCRGNVTDFVKKRNCGSKCEIC